jgi:phosphosulfolactate synthase
VNRAPFDALLDPGVRTAKPRRSGITIIIDKGQMGQNTISDFADTAGAHCDYAKIAWGSSLITGHLEKKLDAYRSHGITPMLGGTLFEYAYLRDKLPILLTLAKENHLHIEVSDGVIDLPRRDKLAWIERFSKHVEVFSEIGGKINRQNHNWKQVIDEELAAGAKKVVVEGREIGPVGQEIRVEFVDTVLAATDVDNLVFEAFERKQQIYFIKRIGPNVNLGNIPPTDLLTLESFRLGLKEHTLLHTWERQKQNAEAARSAPRAVAK